MATNPNDQPIDGHIHVDPFTPVGAWGGGLVAYAAVDRRGSDQIMAVRVPDGESPRADALSGLSQARIPFCLTPLTHGTARDERGTLAQFVICPAPSGLALDPAGGPAWSEDELLENLLRPVAEALTALSAAHVTHRAIRPGNLFQAASGQKVVLGCAWACPPASRQPAAYEPPYSAICSPNARDGGSIADDVYALGVLMVALATATSPMADLDGPAVVARKLSLGSAPSILAGVRLPTTIAELARNMLAEDPEHRPAPGLLVDPTAARARRVAARAPRRASRPVEIGASSAWDARGLAHALGREPAAAVAVLLGGGADSWLRRVLGETILATQLDEAVRQRVTETILDDADADAILLVRAVAVLDPLAPLCWLGEHLWPDALGSVLAAAAPAQTAMLVRLIRSHAIVAWATARPQRANLPRAQADARQLAGLLRQPGWAGGLARLRYALNPLLPCRSARLGGVLVLRAADILPLLEDAAAQADHPALPLDAELAAFVAARSGTRLDAEFATMAQSDAEPHERALAQLRVLAKLQGRAAALPHLAAWLAASCQTMLARIRSRSRRAAAGLAMQHEVASGRLSLVLGVLDDAAAGDADRREAAAAAAAIDQLAGQIAASRHGLAASGALSRRIGREIVASIGLVAVAAVIAMAVL